MNHERIDLEAKIAFLERTLDALSEALHDHGQTIDSLTRRMAQLERRTTSKAPDPEIGPHDSPPPHY